MKKIIHPCTVDGLKAFAAISFEKDILTIHGVIGPTRDGNSKGGSGQCVDEIRTGKPVDDWNEEMLQKFCDRECIKIRKDKRVGGHWLVLYRIEVDL